MENKVEFGLSNVHYAKITSREKGVITYAKPKPIPGAVTLQMDPTGDETKFFADNGVYFARSANTGYTGTLSIAKLPKEFRVEILGEQLLAGGLLESSNAKLSDFALLFQVENDVADDKLVFYDVSASRPSKTANTTNETIDPSTTDLSLTMKPTEDKAVKYVADADAYPEVHDKFYEAVQTVAVLKELTPPELKK